MENEQSNRRLLILGEDGYVLRSADSFDALLLSAAREAAKQLHKPYATDFILSAYELYMRHNPLAEERPTDCGDSRQTPIDNG
jgi:hypothetical protein